jgi:hypothetical protein
VFGLKTYCTSGWMLNTDPRVPNALVGLIRIELAF